MTADTNWCWITSILNTWRNGSWWWADVYHSWPWGHAWGGFVDLELILLIVQKHDNVHIKGFHSRQQSAMSIRWFTCLWVQPVAAECYPGDVSQTWRTQHISIRLASDLGIQALVLKDLQNIFVAVAEKGAYQLYTQVHHVTNTQTLL